MSMPSLDILFKVIGCLAVVLVLVSVAALCVTGAIGSLEDRRRARERLVEHNARRDLGRLIANQAYWFTEDIGAWKAIEAIGQELVEKGDFNSSDCRDRWRKAKAEAEAHYSSGGN